MQILLHPEKQLNKQAASRTCKSVHVRSGFTLIEMIGILAILTILALVIVSATPRSLDMTAGNLERTNLVKFASALQSSILRNRYIPGPTGASNWVQMISTELGVDTSFVTTNARAARRVLLIDPNTIALPYQQGITGVVSNAPPVARMMILSTLGSSFPSGLTDGNTNDFNAIWNTSDGSFNRAGLTGPLQSWTSGTGDDLKIQRIDLRPLFLQLVLFNYPPGYLAMGQYSIDRMAINSVPLTTNGVRAFFLQSTMLGLLTDSSVLQAEQILNHDTSFVYLQGVWKGSLDFKQDTGHTLADSMGAAFAATAAAFTVSPYNTKSTAGVTPPQTLNTISNFMFSYITWANNGFPLTPGNASYDAARISQNNMVISMTSLANDLTVQNAKNGGGNCTNAP